MTSDVSLVRRREGATAKLEFRVLGDTAVVADGRPLNLGGVRQRSVLALLVLQGNRAIATDLLAARLWQDEQPASAIKTIQVYVARLRRALGPNADRLVSSATGYRLAVADDEVDSTRFERGLRQAREALAEGSPDTALATLDEALSLWSGPALGDLVSEPFARWEADRLEELRLQALEELFELQIAAGSGREAIGEIRRLLIDRPGRERLWRLLMLALNADGRQAEALQAYQDARRYLADELGLDPSPEIQQLERAILTQEAPRPMPAVARKHDSDDDFERLNLTDLGLGSEPSFRRRRVVTVIRADVVQPFDGELDPELLERLDRRALDIVSRAVERHGGTINRADPDGVTGVFGLTVAREDDALRAVRAASELQDGAGRTDRSDPVILRVGLATGEVLTSPNDTDGVMLTGQPLQVASRLAAAAAPQEVLLSAATEQLVRGATSTEIAPSEGSGGATVPSAVRLLGLTGGEAFVRQTTTPFVGRVDELAALLAAFERVVSTGMPGLVTVIGAPGVGKSRLVAESIARISKRARVLRSRCLPYGDGITYWPVRDLILAASGIGSSEPRQVALAKLETVLAGLAGSERVRNGVASVVGLPVEPVPAEDIRWAVRRLFEGLATEGPLVLLVDDLQWAEPVLVDLLDHVLDLGRGPMLLIAVARPELTDSRPEWLSRSSLESIRLDALDDADAATLLDHLAPELPPGPLRSRILAAAEGNPLFVEQFVAYVSDEAGVAGGRLDAQTAAALAIPPTIGALLAARLDRLPIGERRLLEEAAVVGRTFWAGALAEHRSDAERRELPGQLARLSRRDLIRPERSELLADDAYRFRHLLIRDAAYASLPKFERAELHERFANWLERRSEANPGQHDLILGYHLEQSYRYRLELGDDGPYARVLADRALRLIGPAGLAAEEQRDVHAAISLLRRAVDLAQPGRQRIELLMSLRVALRIAGESDASAAAEAEAVALLAEYPDEGLEHKHGLIEGWANDDFSIREAQAAYDYFDRTGDSMGMIRALESMVGMALGEGRTIDAADLLDEATALAMKIARPDRAATLTAYLAFLFYYSAIPAPDVMGRLERYLDLAGTNGFSRALILMELGRFEAMSDVGGAWRRHFDEAKAIIDDLGLMIPIGLAGYPKKLGATEVAAGEPARVVEMLQESCSTLDRLGGPMVGHLATIASITAEALFAVGRLEEAERYASWARGISADSPDEQSDWRMAMSRVRSMQGAHDEAVTLAREALSLVGPYGEFIVDLARAHMSLAQALRGAGDEKASLAAAQEARQLAITKQDQAALRKIEAFLEA